MIQHAKYLGQRSFRSKVIVRKHPLDRLLYLNYQYYTKSTQNKAGSNWPAFKELRTRTHQ